MIHFNSKIVPRLRFDWQDCPTDNRGKPNLRIKASNWPGMSLQKSFTNKTSNSFQPLHFSFTFEKIL